MIRDATACDAAEIAELVRGSFEVSLHPYIAYAQHGVHAYLKTLLEHPWATPGTRFLVAEEHRRIIGFAEFRRLDDTTGFLSYICVAEAARGRGVASGLIAAWAKQAPGVTRIELDVFAHNSAARHLYGRLGFTSTASSVWLRRPLPSAEGALTGANIHLTQASLAAYGFGELELRGESVAKVGLMGDKVVRVPGLAAFLDEPLLGRIHAALPGRCEVLAVVPSTQLEAAPHAILIGEVILESVRLSASAAEVHRALKERS